MKKRNWKLEYYKLKTILSNEVKNPFALGISYKLYCLLNQTKQLECFKDIHLGDECFIVGTGPSLIKEDIDLIRGKYSFGVNTLYKIYNQTDWRADYYCVIDPNTYRKVSAELNKYNVKNMFIARNRIRTNDKHNPNVIGFNLNCDSFYRVLNTAYFDGICEFGSNLASGIYDGASVVYAALQIAVYMGFKTIYLIGVDCNYDKEIEKLHNANLGYGLDYKYNWTKQTGTTMIEGFEIAKKYADKNGVTILNASRGGMLEVFPRVKLEEVIND